MVLCACGKAKDPPPQARVDAIDADPAVGVHSDGGYVTSDACAGCHEATHASWYRSFHRTMTQAPSAASILGRFDGEPLDAKGRYRAFVRDGRHFVAQPVAGGRVVSKPVALVTGSHHMQVYWVEGQREALEAFAFAYLLPEQRWVPNEWTLLRPPARADARAGDRVEAVYTWNRVCVKCHAVDGNPGFDAAAGHVESTVAELGIACEACHGPGAAHVAKQRALAARGVTPPDDGAGDETIVDPREDGAAAASQVCAQCHSISVFHDDDAWVAHGRDAPPPAPVSAWGRVIRHPVREHGPWIDALLDTDPDFFPQRYWNDGEVRVSGREYNGMLESPCAASDDFGCTTCHRMHESEVEVDGRPWTDGQLKQGILADAACARCHEDIAAEPSAHTHHAPNSTGSACSNCHMPHTTYGLLGAMRSHTVTSPRVDVSQTTGRPIACNLCHLDRSLRWTADVLTRWYGQPPRVDAPDDGPAAARWMVAGDAGQRALLAWHLGWAPALAASSAPWAAALLDAAVREDPYPAVRLIAERARRAHPADAPAHGLDARWLDRLRSAQDLRPVRLAE